jgi:hypothetical protein
MSRKIVIDLPGGVSPMLEEVRAENEYQLQERLKSAPQLLPLDDLGLLSPAVVVGRESSLGSGKADLVLLCNGGDLAVVEFKTGPQNPDFRSCLAQLLDYGSGLWGMSLEEFEERVARHYFAGAHSGTVAAAPSLDDVVRDAWGDTTEDAVDWRERLEAQLRDGSFHYIAVAQRFTPPVLQTIRYLNATMKGARFSAVELVRFSGHGDHGDVGAFEARFVEGAAPAKGGSWTAKNALAGVSALLSSVTDDDYRHALTDLFDGLATMSGLTVFWGTSGCSLRVAVPDRSPLSVGWIFPPGPPRWMGLTDVTLGWYEDANGLVVSESGRQALLGYQARLGSLPGAAKAKPESVRGYTFAPQSVVADQAEIEDAVRTVVAGLVAG